MKTVTVLGATGSIGRSTLDVISRHPEKFRLFAISGHTQLHELMTLAKKHSPRYVVVADERNYDKAKSLAQEKRIESEILCGNQALEDIASAADVDSVMAAIVGAAGLRPTLAAAKSGKRILLANKEALVMSGSLFIEVVNQNNATILPIDSEHNAIFQCLPHDYRYGDLASSGITKLLLTGSGGPFRNLPLEAMDSVTPADACKHPNWSMGQKISVDSATMMNKGLEFIEACRLFGVAGADIDIVLHPQSTIHSMVQYIDGSVLAQMGNPDMRTPIAHGLAYPERIDAGVATLDFLSINQLTFGKPSKCRYPNLYLAIEAEKQGQCATTTLNAANEVSVSAFLEGGIRFPDIAHINEEVLNSVEPTHINSIQHVLDIDKRARLIAQNIVKERANRV